MEAAFLLMNGIQAQMNKIIFTNVREEYAFTVIDPAVAFDVDDYVHPKRVLIVAGGRVVGVLVWVFLALSGGALQQTRQDRR